MIYISEMVLALMDLFITHCLEKRNEFSPVFGVLSFKEIQYENRNLCEYSIIAENMGSGVRFACV